ncbi:ETX/MTX2 family pore-forming toxin [Bacillus cereus group sp. BfR-BA-01349]|uniref:ETX/MTX2 family pore-forming toxin n=1 Tax=Bacillus cereus group sp. BfR-BA-01349 TaxID=2920312 RepID=UPI001F5860FE
MLQDKNKLFFTGISALTIMASGLTIFSPTASAHTQKGSPALHALQGTEFSDGNGQVISPGTFATISPYWLINDSNDQLLNFYNQVKQRLLDKTNTEQNMLKLDEYLNDLWFVGAISELYATPNDYNKRVEASQLVRWYKNNNVARPTFEILESKLENVEPILDITEPIGYFATESDYTNNSPHKGEYLIPGWSNTTSTTYNTTTTKGFSIGANSGIEIPLPFIDKLGLTGSYNFSKVENVSKTESTTLTIPVQTIQVSPFSHSKTSFYFQKHQYRAKFDVTATFKAEVGRDAEYTNKRSAFYLLAKYNAYLPKGIVVEHGGKLTLEGKGEISVPNHINGFKLVKETKETPLSGGEGKITKELYTKEPHTHKLMPDVSQP